MQQIRSLALGAICGLALGGTSWAADLQRVVPVRVSAPPPVRVLYNWSGFYFGVNFGGGFASQDTSLVSTGTGATLATGDVNPTGFIVGNQIGYNWHVGQWVYGVEADIQGSFQKDDATLTGGGATVNYTTRLRMFGTVRGRVGMAFDRLLPYVTGGWAYGTGSIAGTSPGISFNSDQNFSGWTVGTGVEWAMLDNWTAKAEYLYMDLGDGATALGTRTANIVGEKFTNNVVRVGLNYKF